MTPASLQRPHTTQAGRRRDPRPFGQVDVGHASILLQSSEDATIYRIKHHGVSGFGGFMIAFEQTCPCRGGNDNLIAYRPTRKVKTFSKYQYHIGIHSFPPA